ncbi:MULTISPECIES: AI-2E family transporter [unclassified Nocardioides]|uniref:AI-2E family transporter n=1 Tax=unclassified Nocardioides TaxID=2615069 RepID=UPI00129738E5|nr:MULTISPECIES: AI-2E family transporter [unclassified Nocardioides]
MTASTPAPAPRSREQVIARGLEWCARWSARWILIFIALWLASKVLGQMWTILLPVVLALIVSTVLAPISWFLERRLRMPPSLAAASTLLGAIAAIVAIGFALAPSTAGQAGAIADDAAAGLDRIAQWLRDSDLVTGKQVDTAIDAVQDKLTASASTIASGVLVGVGAVTSALVTLIVTLILTFLFLKDGRRFLPWLRRLAGPSVGTHLAEVLGRAWATLGGFIRTQALVSAIDAVFIGLGLVLVGVPLALPLAVLTFFGGFVPIVGAFVVGALAVLVALVSNGWVGALIILGVVLAVQQLEGNVLSPWLQSRSMSLHAAVVLLSVALGSSLFGIVGAFLAVPVTAMIAVVFRYLDEQVTARSEAPVVSAPPADAADDDADTGPRRGPEPETPPA